MQQLVVIFLEPHEICPEQNTGDIVWKKTPAGDVAAVSCPADASGTLTVWKLTLYFRLSNIYLKLS